MNIITPFRLLIVAACLMVVSPLSALGDPPPMPPGHGMEGAPHEHGMMECPMHGGGPQHGMMGGGMMHGGFMFDEDDAVPPPLHRLNLTEAQQDKIFGIMHAQAPQARELRKAIRNAHRGLHELVTGTGYDEAKAKKLTDALGKATADSALLHARTHHQILEVLTPEQRESLTRHAGCPGGEPCPHDHGEHAPGPPR